MGEIDARREGVEAVHISLRQRSGFAVQHLIAASSLSRQAEEIESKNWNEPLGPFYDELFGLSSACVMLSVASLEAYVNEFLGSPEAVFPELPGEETKNLLRKFERKSGLLDKYAFVANEKRAAIDWTGAEVDNVKQLISIRNKLVHAKPHWLDETEYHAEIAASLRPRFSLNRWYVGSEPTFPYSYVGHGLCQWSVSCVKVFTSYFAREMNLPHRLDQFDRLLQP